MFYTDTPQWRAVQDFLTEKIAACRKKKEDTDETWNAFYDEFSKNPSAPVDGFKISTIQRSNSHGYGAETEISILNDAGNGCFVCCGLSYDKTPQMDMHALIAAYQSDYSNITHQHGVIKRFLEQLPAIEEAIPGIIMECDKELKIIELTENSVHAWIAETMKQNGFTYYTEEGNGNVKLCIMMTKKLQLNITIIYSSFHKLVPTLLNAIEQYKALITSVDAKITISHFTNEMRAESNKKYKK